MLQKMADAKRVRPQNVFNDVKPGHHYKMRWKLMAQRDGTHSVWNDVKLVY